MLGVGLVYFLRLDAEKRCELDAELQEITRARGGLSVDRIVEEETKAYIDRIKVEPGIALNKALKVRIRRKLC